VRLSGSMAWFTVERRPFNEAPSPFFCEGSLYHEWEEQ
jgi:hypothetical protein